MGIDLISKIQIHEKISIHSSFWLLYTFWLIDIICSLINIYQVPTMWTGTMFGTGGIGVVKTNIVPVLYKSMNVFDAKEQNSDSQRWMLSWIRLRLQG